MRKASIVLLALALVFVIFACALPVGYDPDADATEVIESLATAQVEQPELFDLLPTATPED